MYYASCSAPQRPHRLESAPETTQTPRERPTTAATRETAATRRCRDDEWIGKVFFAKFDPKAIWYDDLDPLPGMSLPWEEAGLPRPCVDEPCQVEWMDEFLEPVYPLEVV